MSRNCGRAGLGLRFLNPISLPSPYASSAGLPTLISRPDSSSLRQQNQSPWAEGFAGEARGIKTGVPLGPRYIPSPHHHFFFFFNLGRLTLGAFHFSGTVKSTFHILTHLILTPLLRDSFSYYIHFTGLRDEHFSKWQTRVQTRAARILFLISATGLSCPRG